MRPFLLWPCIIFFMNSLYIDLSEATGAPIGIYLVSRMALRLWFREIKFL